MKIIDTFKKSHGIRLIGLGNWDDVMKKMELPPDGERWNTLSSGMIEGNFLHLDMGDGYNAYAFLTDPLYGDGWLVWIVRGRRSLPELRESMPMCLKLISQAREGFFEGKRKCWECGQEFSFWDISIDDDFPAWKSFRRRIEMWEEGYCGC